MPEVDCEYMAQALELAQQAWEAGEVPVGAVVVLQQKIIGRGYNQSIRRCDPSAHAEVLALRHAARALGNYRLTNASLYVTLEPCVMCAGAILHARIARLVYGARDAKFGSAGSLLNIPEAPFFNHRCKIISGVCEAQCGQMMEAFFATKRNRNRC